VEGGEQAFAAGAAAYFEKHDLKDIIAKLAALAG
jgi:hypothetical protein